MGAFIPGIVTGLFPPKPQDITYPPELLPSPDGPAEVVVFNADGSQRVVSPDEVSDFTPETPQKRIVSDS